MRRSVILILIIAMLSATSGCRSGSVSLSESGCYNYNNISANNCNFWLADSALYYGHNTWFSRGYYRSTATSDELILSVDDATPWKVLEYDGVLYLQDILRQGVFRLSAYDLATNTKEGLVNFSDVYSYFVVDQSLYYLQKMDTGSETIQSLRVYSLVDETQKVIEYSVLGAGVINDEPVYITQAGNQFQLYRYVSAEDRSERMADFSFELEPEEIIEDYVNFTSERIILTVSDDFTTKIVCYEFESDNITTHSIKGWASSVIAYEKYAFVVVTKNTWADAENWKNTFYRICLESGDMKKLGRMRGFVNTFVASDDAVYAISSRNERTFYRYDASGKRSVAYRV